MSEDRLEEIKNRWQQWDQGTLGEPGIIYSHGDISWLISEVERFQQKDGLRTREHNILVQENRNLTLAIAALREALENKDVEWSSGPERNKCPWCNGLYQDHRPNCERQEALK